MSKAVVSSIIWSFPLTSCKNAVSIPKLQKQRSHDPIKLPDKAPWEAREVKIWVSMVLYPNKYQKTLFLSWSLVHIFSKIFYFNHMSYLKMSSTI